MTLQGRANIIDQLSQHLNRPVVAYVTGDRPGLETQVSADQLARFPRHLDAVGKHDQLALLLYTRGGDTNVPWSVVSFLREYCDHLIALVPFAAHSSGTLLALGADEIAMSRFATLSPIDPTVANAFNPQDPTNPAARIPVAVEDVLAYLELAHDNVDGEAFTAAFQRLVESVHPLALGNVKRSINQIRQLATKMIGLHPPDRTEEELAALVTRLTTEFYSHQHLINRGEARSMGLPIAAQNDQLETLMLSYYNELRIDLDLLDPLNPAAMLRAAGVAPAGGAQPLPIPQQPAQQPVFPAPPGTTLPPVQQPALQTQPVNVQVVFERALVETSTTCDAFITRGEIGQQVIPTPQGLQQAVALEVHSEGWEVVV